MNRYAWTQGFPAKVDPQIAGEMCEQLRAQGDLTAENLLAANVAEDAPLHQCFEWDDSVAAHKYRVRQAGAIICNIRVIKEPEQKPIKRYYSIVKDDPHYESVEVLMSHEESRERLLRNSRREFETFAEKYRQLTEWAHVIEEGLMV